MKLKEAALIAEIAGGLAIVITLIFLVVEVRTNSGLVERQIQLELSSGMEQTILLASSELLEHFARIDEVDGTARPLYEALKDRYGFDAVEVQRLARFYRMQWLRYLADYESGRTDVLRVAISSMLAFPDQRLYWELEFSQLTQGREFNRFVREIIEEMD